MWDEVSKLGQLPEIKNVLFVGNPIYADRKAEENGYLVLKRLPQCESVDGKPVTVGMR